MPIIKSRRKYSTSNILRQIWPILVALSTDIATLYNQGGFFRFPRVPRINLNNPAVVQT